MNKIIQLLFCCSSLIYSISALAQQEVMTWISPYYINDSKIVLESSYGGIPVKSTLTRIGLQFWNINSNGKINLMSNINNLVNDSQVRWFADWGFQNNIKILLTVVNDGGPENGYNSFDWRLVREACYGVFKDTLIVNLLAEVDKYGLDGIDLDLEGENAHGPYTVDDNLKYAVFVNNLCDSLHSRGKICTLDSYSETEFGAPRPSWWRSWKEKIDAIHTMGYTSEYWSNPTGNSYQNLQNLAINEGIEPQKLLFGMPMWVDKWAGINNNMGTSNIENLNYILNCLTYQTGITLWDIHAPMDVINGTSIHPWTADTVWSLLKSIRYGQLPDSTICPPIPESGNVIDDMSNIGVNLKAGIWSAFSDNWSRLPSDLPNSTKVLTIDRSYDLALQFGSWGEIGPGYGYDYANGQEIKSIIKTISKAGINEAEGGFMMNFLPVDRSIDTTAEAWEITKIGVERNLSAYNKLVIGAKGTAGKKIRIYLVSRAQLLNGTPGYGSYFTCTGNYEDYELPFASLKPIWGSGSSGFDAAHSLRLTIEFVDPAPPAEIFLTIAGVALDTSVLRIKHLLDCNGDAAGLARLDICGICSGGNTGRIAETNPDKCPECDTYSTLSINTCSFYISPGGKYSWSVSGTYKDTIPNYSGCDSIILLDLVIGKNSKSTIYPSACNSYTSPDGKKIWTSSGIYTDTIQNFTGCDSIITVKLIVKKVPVSMSQSEGTLTADASTGTFRWFSCGEDYIIIENANSRSFTPVSSGEYAVEITQNGCRDTSACYPVTITGLDQNSFGNGLKIFPNPTNGKIRIILPASEKSIEVELKNALGQSYRKEVFYQKQEIDLSFQAPAGLYFLVLKNNEQQQYVMKLVIK